MHRHGLLVGIGCGAAVFVAVAGLITTVIQVGFVAAVLATLAGGMAGVLTAGAVTLQFDRLRPRRRWLAEGVGGLGYALAVLAAVSSVLGGNSIDPLAAVALAVLVGVAAGVRAWRQSRT